LSTKGQIKTFDMSLFFIPFNTVIDTRNLTKK